MEKVVRQKFWEKNPKTGRILGTIFILMGFLSFITPLTPFGFFFLIGLEFLGVRAKYWRRLKNWVEQTAEKL